MIDNELKNKLLDIYKGIYTKASTNKSSYWDAMYQGELIGASRVMTELGLSHDMGAVRTEVERKTMESFND